MIQLTDKAGFIRQKGIFPPVGVFSPGLLISKTRGHRDDYHWNSLIEKRCMQKRL